MLPENPIPHVLVVDPGLMEAGGHHAGLASMLTEDIKSGLSRKLSFVCHAQLDKRLLMCFESSGIATFPLFTSNFYSLIAPRNTLTDYDEGIAILAAEYHRAFEIALSASADNKVLFFPCVAWQHAMALNAALVAIKQGPYRDSLLSVRFITCAMFNPGLSGSGGILNSQELHRSKLAFKWLNKHQECSIVTSDAELSVAYQLLLNEKLPCPMHPCYLVNWQRFKTLLEETSREPNRVILYSGDAKIDKGFNQLPYLVKRCLATFPEKQWVIQFTQNWPTPELDEAIKVLESIAKSTTKLQLYRMYWQPEELMLQFARASAISLQYDEDIYQHKSSGMLWLAAFAGLTVWVQAQSWLTREAARLGVETHIVKSENEDLTKTVLSKGEAFDKGYATTLFQDIWAWLDSLCTTDSDLKVVKNV